MAVTEHLCMQCMLETDSRETVCPYCGYPTNSEQLKPYLPLGIILGERYIVGKMIKRTIDSAVYIGRDTQLDKTVEIREFFPCEISQRADDSLGVVSTEGHKTTFDEYFQSYYQLWKNLMRFKGLPALFEVAEVFEENNTVYAVTDHNDCTTFRKILDTMNVEKNPFSLSRVKLLINSILSTVESLHTANVVHRGISPETLVLASDGTLKITGFSIPQVRTTKNKLICGVCDGYAAIEQYDFNWQQGSWTDIYAIGALIYKMLTGRTLAAAPSRLNDEEIFFTPKELESIPKEFIAVIKGSLVLMPQGRIKDIHELIDVFSPREEKKKTVTAVKRKAVLIVSGDDKRDDEATEDVQADDADSESTSFSPIVKPKQAEPETKTSQKPVIIPKNRNKKVLEEIEAEKKRREELVQKQRQERDKARLEEKRRRESAKKAARMPKESDSKLVSAIKKLFAGEGSPAALAAVIGVGVSVTCILITFILYGTVLYKYVDAPVLDNCLSHLSFLPVNSQNDSQDDVDYVEVPDFRMLTKEYIENDSLYSKRYNIIFEYDYCDTVEKGYVFAQSISPNENVQKGTAITVYISKGIELIKMIDVKDMQYEDAEILLTDIGFTVEKKEVYNIAFHTKNKVISSSIEEGEEFPKGTTVTLSVWGPMLSKPTTEATTQEGQTTESNGTNNGGGFFSFWRDILGLG